MVNAVSNLMPTNGEEQPIPGAKMSSRSKKNKPSKPAGNGKFTTHPFLTKLDLLYI